MNMNLIIRPARATDVEVVCEFNRLMASETEYKTLDHALLRAGVAAMLAEPRKGRYFVAEADGQVVGQLGITLEWSDCRNGNFWWIQSVYVATSVRRHGVFRQLYEHVLREARAEADVIGVRLYVDHGNSVAQATYKKMGMMTTDYRLMEVYPLK